MQDVSSDSSHCLRRNWFYVPFPFKKHIFKCTSVDNFWGRKKKPNHICLSVAQLSGWKRPAAQHFGAQWTFLRWIPKYGTAASLFTAVFQSNRLDTAALWLGSCVQRHYGGSPEQMDCIFRCHHIVREKRYGNRGKKSLFLFLSVNIWLLYINENNVSGNDTKVWWIASQLLLLYLLSPSAHAKEFHFPRSHVLFLFLYLVIVG